MIRIEENLAGTPPGWTKQIVPRRGSSRADIYFFSPDNQKLRSRKELERYLTEHPGGPSMEDFDWKTGAMTGPELSLLKRHRDEASNDGVSHTKKKRQLKKDNKGKHKEAPKEKHKEAHIVSNPLLITHTPNPGQQAEVVNVQGAPPTTSANVAPALTLEKQGVVDAAAAAIVEQQKLAMEDPLLQQKKGFRAAIDCIQLGSGRVSHMAAEAGGCQLTS
eukprot:jgi/Mesen1/9210/ME000591S08522